jgi:adenylate cyclase class 2
MNERKLQEVEVKLHTPDLADVKRALEAAGATLVKPRVYERNVRYDSADGTLSAQGVVLRLRRDDAARLTFKADERVVDGIASRFEAEVEVSDFALMDVILRRLGYKVVLIYEKYRTTYALEGAEVVLDELPFGNFSEIEGDAATIERVVATLGLGGARRMRGSYVYLFLGLKRRLGLAARDCTFEAFAGADVDVRDLV